MQKPDILSKYCLGMAAWLCCACCDCCVHLLQLRIARGRDSLRWTPRHRRHTADEGSWSKCNHEQLEPEVIMHKHTKLLHTGDQTMGTEPNTLLRTTHVFCVFCVLMTMNAETIVHTVKNWCHHSTTYVRVGLLWVLPLLWLRTLLWLSVYVHHGNILNQRPQYTYWVSCIMYWELTIVICIWVHTYYK